jgi:hypothetical protein
MPDLEGLADHWRMSAFAGKADWRIYQYTLSSLCPDWSKGHSPFPLRPQKGRAKWLMLFNGSRSSAG